MISNAQSLESILSGRIRTRIKLSEAERLIRTYRITVPCPSRQTLVRLCEEGIFETPPRRNHLWEIYEDSFWRWAIGENDEIQSKRNIG